MPRRLYDPFMHLTTASPAWSYVPGDLKNSSVTPDPYVARVFGRVFAIHFRKWKGFETCLPLNLLSGGLMFPNDPLVSAGCFSIVNREAKFGGLISLMSSVPYMRNFLSLNSRL